MNELLSFLEKIYTDSKILTIFYIVGGILLFIFIIMLIASIKSKDEEKIIVEEPKNDDSNSILDNETFQEKDKLEDTIIIKNENDVDLNNESTDPVDNYEGEIKTALEIVDEKKDEENVNEYLGNILDSNIEEESNEDLKIKQEELKAKLDSLRKNN